MSIERIPGRLTRRATSLGQELVNLPGVVGLKFVWGSETECLRKDARTRQMHTESIERWVHDHTFGQDRKKSAEHRTLIVIVITLVTMTVEIAAGIAFGSMALLADGLHMGSHASALAISVFAYRYTRTHAKDVRFNFGTGNVNSLAAFASASMLALIALAMAL